MSEPDIIADFEDEIARLRALNAELLAALKKVESAISCGTLVAEPGYSDDVTALELIRAAIAKAKGKA